MGAVIRLAREEDAWGMLEIYTPIVRETAISFELDPPSVEELQHRVATYLDFAPWLVCCRQESILGYAYASQHRVREAYQWSVDVSVYVNERFRNQGVATALYKSLFGCLALQGFYNAYAGITQPNAASVALHESLGFQLVGIYRGVGYKLGQWHDVGWWHLALNSPDNSPARPLALKEVSPTLEWQGAIESGLEWLRV